jgi:predicted ATPase
LRVHWAGAVKPGKTSQALNRLGERETAAIIARLVGNKELPADVMAEILGRTDGIPLFVEEMTKAVLEAESEDAARRTIAAVPSPARVEEGVGSDHKTADALLQQRREGGLQFLPFNC